MYLEIKVSFFEFLLCKVNIYFIKKHKWSFCIYSKRERGL